MMKITTKRKINHDTSNLAIVINATLFLVDFPDDICQWFLKTIEVIALFALLMTSWKWRICPMFQFYFQNLFQRQNFLILKNKIIMNGIKIVVGFAIGFLILLMSLLTFLENPEKKLYEETVESLMVHEGLSSAEEVLDSFPEIKKIKSKIERIAYLKSSIHSIIGGPAPNVSKEESQYLLDCSQEISLLQREVKENLTPVLANYAKSHP